jgi:flagellar basal body-associated protein FliL
VNFKLLARFVITMLLFGVVIYWMWMMSGDLRTGATNDATGNAVDPFQRSKDVLLVALPLLTTAVGYWFGAEGKERAEQRAHEAQEKSASSLERALHAEAQLAASSLRGRPSTQGDSTDG